jgi:ATP-dependent RNA helicase DDX27
MESVEKFQNGECDFLLATDVLARGIDIYKVNTIINFNFPREQSAERYIHRVGRTARAGLHGVSITICDDEER